MIEKKPWGWFIRLVNTRFFWVKLIKVNPGHRTSLQSHDKRSELHLSINYFGKGEKHRMGQGWYIEFALGRPREEDIKRYDDDYGRSDEKIHRNSL